jgi:AraC-like DNA-binding protein
VSYAKQLLLEDKSVKEIGYSLGFDNESGFVSFFKRHCGVSPGVYKKENHK